MIDSRNSCKVTKLIQHIADKDITVYKVFRRKTVILYYGDIQCVGYYGPYTDYKYTSSNTIIGKTLTPEPLHYDKNIFCNIFKNLFNGCSQCFAESDEPKIKWNTDGWYDIKEGFIHSTPDPISKFYKYEFGHCNDLEQYRCIIPKGTKYYQADTRGSHAERCNSYASEKLIVIEKINTPIDTGSSMDSPIEIHTIYEDEQLQD